MMKQFYGLIFTILSLGAGFGCIGQNIADITPAELKKHVEFLASQELAGRYPGTKGDQTAAGYIRNSFRDYGLKFMSDSGFQRFRVTTGIHKGTANKLEIGNITGVSDQDFVPVSISDNGVVKAQLVFVGYGLRVNSDSVKWDDYSGIDVKGKVALMLYGAPEPAKGSADDPFEEYGSVRSKLLTARDAGASAVIFVAGPVYDAQDELDFGSVRENSAGLSVIRAKRSFINQVLASTGLNIDDAEKLLNTNHKPNSKELGLMVSLQTDLVTESAETQNVVGYVEAPDSSPETGWIVVGAHYDHLGMGGLGSSSRVQDTIGVHPGADDNASGVAAIIEMAGYISSISDRLTRSVLFVAFSGEEMGLLGSKFFVANPLVPLRQIAGMINLDMIGRPNGEKRLAISGIGTSDGMDSLLSMTSHGNLLWAKSPEGSGPSDHASFYTADIPVLYFSTGAHLDYHTPADTPDKLDYLTMDEIATQVSGIILTLSNASAGLTFKESGPKVSDSGRRKLKVTLGIMPDVSGTENNGLRVEYATPGKPAQLAGITKGDRITAMNGLPVTNVYDYMTRLQSLKTGQTVSVELVRGDEKILVLVQL